jgi:hypothetical protein
VTSHGSAQVSVIHQHRSPILPDDDMAPVMETTRYATQRNAMLCNAIYLCLVIPVHHHHHPPPPTTGYQPGSIHHLYSLYWIVPCTSTLILVVCLFCLRLIEEHGRRRMLLRTAFDFVYYGAFIVYTHIMSGFLYKSIGRMSGWPGTHCHEYY